MKKPMRNTMMEELIGRLSPEARDLWREFERVAETPSEQHKADHRDKVTDLAMRSMQLPAEDQVLWEELAVEKKRALDERIQRERKEAAGLKWLGRQMQEEGLRQGLNKEQRKKATIGELFLNEESST